MRKSPLLPIFLIVLVDVLGMTIMWPLLPFYAVYFGATATVVGLLTTSYAFCQLIAAPVLGNMSDRWGRRPLLIASQLGTCAGFLIMANAHALWMLFLARVIDGATAGNLSLAQAYIADVTEAKDRTKSFAVIGIAFGLSFSVGPALSGILFARYGFACPIYLAAALSAGSVLCTALLLPKTEPHLSRHVGGEEPGPGGKRLGMLEWKYYAQYFARPGLGKLLWEFFFFAFSFSFFMGGFALFANARYRYEGHAVGPHEIGMILAYVGVLGVILQGGLIGRLVKVMGERKLVWTGFAASAVSYVVMGWSRTIGQLLISSTINSYGNGVLRPAVTALITHKVSKQETGVVLGLTQSLSSISFIVGPALAGVMIDRGWLTGWAFAIAAVSLAGMVLSLAGKYAE